MPPAAGRRAFAGSLAANRDHPPMITPLVITDLTRMQQGRVCVAGYDQHQHPVRPVLPPPGISESALYKDGQPNIFPFALVEFDLQEADPQPPHTEDVFFMPDSPRLVRV